MHKEMKPTLSILIPITPDRMETVKPLLRKFSTYNHGDFQIEMVGDELAYYRYYDFYTPEVEIILSLDDKILTLGEKRELLYKKAQGEYSWQIDSDDMIDYEAVELILKAINDESPDCITFEESVTIDGKLYRSNHSLEYDKWRDDFDGYDFTRSVFYKDVIKTEIAQSVPFPKIRYNEDEQWSALVMPHLKTEIHIPKQLYIYQYTSTPFNERYGITNG